MNIFSLVWKTKDLRNKILVVLLLLLATRVLAQIPIPGIDIASLQQFFQSSQFLGLLNIFSGGGLANFSIAMLGISPYITASIIIQLLTILVPSLKEMQKEGGEQGRIKLNQYTRYLTIPLAVLQGFGTIRLIQSQPGGAALLSNFTPFQWFLTLLSITAGTMLVMWIGEIISEYGIGNGSSLIIFAGIVARVPQYGGQMYELLFKGGADTAAVSIFVIFALVLVAIIMAIILMTEAQRNIPISYAKHVRGEKTYGGVNTHLPLRLNQAGVIPIIFAISLMLFPSLIAQFFRDVKSETVRHIASKITDIFNPASPDFTYGIIYFILVVLFTYFYTAIIFNPDEVAENVQKSGGFIPGLRPGKQTAEYLYRILNRILLPGSVFLGLIAVLPFIMPFVLEKTIGSSSTISGQQLFAIGGTSLLIVVAVVIETIKQIEAQLTMHDYDSLS